MPAHRGNTPHHREAGIVDFYGFPSVLVVVDNRLRLPLGCPAEFVKRLREVTTHSNPDYGKKRALGHWVQNTPTDVKTWRKEPDGTISLPRGVTGKVRMIAKQLGIRLRWEDRRLSVPVQWGPFLTTPRVYQVEGRDACVSVEQGIVRAPTGSGKTCMALAVLPELGQRSLVVVREKNLLNQWRERAQTELGLPARELGMVAGGKRKVGERLTIALQQSLYSKSFPLHEFSQLFGAVVVDEVHEAAARTVNETVDAFPARARLGFSADHTRKDRKEFLVHDLFGDVIYEVGKQQLERSGDVCPVCVRLVPTDFEANWYTYAPAEERDFVRLVAEMSEDEERNRILRTVILELVASGRVPALVFTHRRDHAEALAQRMLLADGVPAGLLMGGRESDFAEYKALLMSGKLKVAVGTFKAIGQGIDLPSVLAGVCATPIGSNRQFFGQVRGRVCRPFPGKTVGHLYYLWDREVFPDAARNLVSWNDGLVEVFNRSHGRWVPFRA